MKRTPLAALLLASLGCTTVHVIPLSELRKLDGYDVRSEGATPRLLRDADGAEVPFSSERPLSLVPAIGPPLTGRFARIRLVDGDLRGVLDDGLEIERPLAGYERVELTTVSFWKTAGAAIGSVVVTAAVVWSVAILCLLASLPGRG